MPTKTLIPMKRPILRFALLAALALSSTPLLPAQDVGEPTAESVPEWQMNFENISPEDRARYSEALMRGTTLFNQKRILEAINSVNDAMDIFDSAPAAMNLKGACYVEFRHFDKARELFQQALTLAPKSTSILFNLAEMDFVTGRWQDCHDRMSALIPLLSPKEVSMRQLIEFKLMLAMIKLGKMDEATELGKKYDFADDTPYYYYASAALDYKKGNTAEAERWLASARRVFRSQEALSPWQDTLIEYGYIKSLYGGDLGSDTPEIP